MPRPSHLQEPDSEPQSDSESNSDEEALRHYWTRPPWCNTRIFASNVLSRPQGRADRREVSSFSIVSGSSRAHKPKCNLSTQGLFRGATGCPLHRSCCRRRGQGKGPHTVSGRGILPCITYGTSRYHVIIVQIS